MPVLTRRLFVAGTLASLSGCGAIKALNDASAPLDTFDLQPAAGASTARRRSRTLVIPLPQASAALATDRITIKPDPASITYLPAARWSDTVPALVQRLLIRSISATGGIGYVGPSEGGPVPDKALLARIDAFEVHVLGAGGFQARIELHLTMINDRDQRVTASRRFAATAAVASDTTTDVVAGFQHAIDQVMPEIADWVIRTV